MPRPLGPTATKNSINTRVPGGTSRPDGYAMKICCCSAATGTAWVPINRLCRSRAHRTSRRQRSCPVSTRHLPALPQFTGSMPRHMRPGRRHPAAPVPSGFSVWGVRPARAVHSGWKLAYSAGYSAPIGSVWIQMVYYPLDSLRGVRETSATRLSVAAETHRAASCRFSGHSANNCSPRWPP